MQGRLYDLLVSVEYSPMWLVFAKFDGELNEDSQAICLKGNNYGYYDGDVNVEDYHYICNGENINYFLSEWEDEDGELVDGWFEEFIEPINEAILEEIEAYDCA